MIILITGATHTGKTCLAQRLLEQLHYPYLSLDHLKMGLIRSGMTALTPDDDREMTDFLWPITREMIKTAIENEQNMIIEGCYIPFDWKNSFKQEYLEHIRYICLALSDDYLEKSFEVVKAHGSDVESRLQDDSSTLDANALKRDNHFFIDGCEANHLEYLLIRSDYEQELQELIGFYK